MIIFNIVEICENLVPLKIQRDICLSLTSSVSEIACLLANGMTVDQVCASLKSPFTETSFCQSAPSSSAPAYPVNQEDPFKKVSSRYLK